MTADTSAISPQGRFVRRLLAWVGRKPSAPTDQALREAQANAQRAEARLREALDALPEGIVFLDEERRYVLWNERYAEIYHRSSDLFERGARLADTLRIGVERGDYPEAVGREEEWLADRMALMEHPGQRHEQLLADGRWVMIEERHTSDGWIIGLRIDITDMKLQAQALEAALHRAEAANQAKTEFLANLSHEIRTPLNGVLGLVDVLLNGANLNAAQREVVRTIGASSGALNTILTDLIDFSRLETGQLEITEEDFELAELVGESVALFETAAQDKGLALRFDVAAAARVRVKGDAARVRQILTNLISNALKFTDAGLVMLTVTTDESGFKFQVRDTGIGFDPDQAERLFARFEQADGSATREHGGVGLGLSICRQLAGLMGGTISATSQPGVGSTFTLVLPLRPVDGAMGSIAVANQHPDNDALLMSIAPAAGETPLRVLVTDDNATNRLVAELILQTIGAEVVCAENGLEAVRAVEREAFDLVLMDLQMPVMDGLTAIREIRAREVAGGLARLPVVVVSANIMPEQRAASAAAGADDHLGKPVRAEDLIEAVFRAVQPGERQLEAVA